MPFTPWSLESHRPWRKGQGNRLPPQCDLMTAIRPLGQASWKGWYVNYKHWRIEGLLSRPGWVSLRYQGYTWFSLYQAHPLAEREGERQREGEREGQGVINFPHSFLLLGPNFEAFNGNQSFPSILFFFSPLQIVLHFSLLNSIQFVTSSPIYQFWFTCSLFLSQKRNSQLLDFQTSWKRAKLP